MPGWRGLAAAFFGQVESSLIIHGLRVCLPPSPHGPIKLAMEQAWPASPSYYRYVCLGLAGNFGGSQNLPPEELVVKAVPSAKPLGQSRETEPAYRFLVSQALRGNATEPLVAPGYPYSYSAPTACMMKDSVCRM